MWKYVYEKNPFFKKGVFKGGAQFCQGGAQQIFLCPPPYTNAFVRAWFKPIGLSLK